MEIGLLLFFGSGALLYIAALLYREFVTIPNMGDVPVEVIEQVAQIVRDTAG